MSELIKKISEYFTGAYTSRFHDKERNFYREFVTDEDKLKSLLNSSNELENELRYPVCISNILDMISLYAATHNKNYLYGIIPVELTRLFYHIKSKKNKMMVMKQINEIRSNAQSELSPELSDILNENNRKY